MDYETLLALTVLVLIAIWIYLLSPLLTGKGRKKNEVFRTIVLINRLHQEDLLKKILELGRKEIESATDSGDVLAERTRIHDQTVMMCEELFPEDDYSMFYIDV